MRGVTLNKRELELKIESVEEISVTHTSSFRSFRTSLNKSEHTDRNNFSCEDLFATALCSASLQNIFQIGKSIGVDLVGTTGDITTVVDGEKSRLRRIVLDIRLSKTLNEEQLQELRVEVDNSNIFGALGPTVLFEHRIHNLLSERQSSPGPVAA